MGIRTITQILESPVLANVFVLAILISLFFYLRRKDTEGQATSFLATLFLLLARDVLVAVFGLPEIHFIGDVFFYVFVLFVLLLPYTRTKPLLILLAAVNVVFAALYTLKTLFSIFTVLPGWFFSCIFFLDIIIGALVLVLKRKEKETQAQLLISEIWIFALATLLVYALAKILLGSLPIFGALLVPLSYWWFVPAALGSLRLQDEQMVAATTYYEESIDSLYNLFLNTGTVLKGSFATEDILSSMNQTIVSETEADGGILFLVDEFDDQIMVKSYIGSFPPPFALPESLPRKQNRIESYMKHLQFSLGETIFGDIAKTGKNVFIAAAQADPRIVKNGDEDFLRITSFMAVPLMVEDKIIGVLAVVKTGVGAQFTEKDFDRCKLLGNFGTLALSHFFSFLEANERSGLKQSADTAAEIQKTILPKKLPQFPTLQMGAFSAPAVGVSGDYYDVIQTRKDRIIGIIGDVAGKGVAAALVMVMIRSILHLVTNTSRDMATVLDWINRGITGKIELDHYCTLSVIGIDMSTGEVEYANAGHQPLLIYRRASNSLETIEIESVPIGVEKNTEYARKILKLADGDIVIMYTDGIVEAMNEQGRQYGRKTLCSVITKHKDLAPKDIVAKIKSDVSAFVGAVRQHDDQTVLVFKMVL